MALLAGREEEAAAEEAALEKYVVESRKACSVNPLKMSQPLGAAYAFMGLESCMPVMHGSQGCTSFGLVLLVRHFKEAIPLQTTAMNEVTTILGGYDNLEKALLNIRSRAKPAIIAICGYAAPPPSALECIAVDGVDWVVQPRSNGVQFTTYGREPALDVLVPSAYAPEPLVLPAFGAVARSLPTTGRTCT